MTNKHIIYLTIISIIIMIAIPTTYTVIKNHYKKLNVVVEKRITEAARECYKKDLCSKDKITLKELYETEFLKDKESDPKTKKYYKEESYVDVNNNFKFVIIK